MFYNNYLFPVVSWKTMLRENVYLKTGIRWKGGFTLRIWSDNNLSQFYPLNRLANFSEFPLTAWVVASVFVQGTYLRCHCLWFSSVALSTLTRNKNVTFRDSSQGQTFRMNSFKVVHAFLCGEHLRESCFSS